MEANNEVLFYPKDIKELFNKPISRRSADTIIGFKEILKLDKKTAMQQINNSDAIYIGETDHSAENLRIRQENAKYYTPSIENIHIGYECEEQIYPEYDKPFWKSLIIGKEYNPADSFRERKTVKLPFPEFIRTSYLTKEQIEKEGFQYRRGTYFSKDNKISITSIGNDPDIYYEITIQKEDHADSMIFKILSINEFKQIFKFLNIK